jgi:hypothetical protein
MLHVSSNIHFDANIDKREDVVIGNVLTSASFCCVKSFDVIRQDSLQTCCCRSKEKKADEEKLRSMPVSGRYR